MEAQTERFQSLATRLYDAALKGDVPSLLNLLREDPLILDRCSIEKTGRFTHSPLHVAANLGHLQFTIEILRRKPELAEVLDQTQRSSPLHMSSSKGHLEIVKALTSESPGMCLARDQDGRNPVHVAAIRGQIHVLDELLRANPQAARERTTAGETVLHLCVKHSHPEALVFLVNRMDDGEMLNSKDGDGNTVLHLAIAAKQPEIVKFLVKDKRMEKNVINTNGLTAMDTYIQSRKDGNDRRIWRSLKHAKALRAKEALKPQGKPRVWLEKQRNALMVVASLIATMAFQVGVNPPGGGWQDGSNGYRAGHSIMADTDKGRYEMLLICNTVGLMSSLSVILLLISGLPCQRLFVVILMMTMWIAVTGTTMTYWVSVDFLSSPKTDSAVWLAVRISLVAWIVLMLLLILGHVIRLLVKLLKQLVLLFIKLCRRCCTRAATRPPV